jgi:O-antigen/teichoic acid export membrane protein
MSGQPTPPRRLHRAAILIALMLFSVAWLVFTIPDPARIDGRSLIALAVVVVLAAVGGIGFSWRRYFRRR